MFLRGGSSSARLRLSLLFSFPVSPKERNHASKFSYENYTTARHILLLPNVSRGSIRHWSQRRSQTSAQTSDVMCPRVFVDLQLQLADGDWDFCPTRSFTVQKFILYV